MRESVLLKKCIERLKELRAAGEPIYWVKFHGNPYTRAGTPDLHVTYKGMSLWLELKTQNKKATPLQCREIVNWKSAGAISEVVKTVDEMEELLKSQPMRC